MTYPVCHVCVVFCAIKKFPSFVRRTCRVFGARGVLIHLPHQKWVGWRQRSLTRQYIQNNYVISVVHVVLITFKWADIYFFSKANFFPISFGTQQRSAHSRINWYFSHLNSAQLFVCSLFVCLASNISKKFVCNNSNEWERERRKKIVIKMMEVNLIQQEKASEGLVRAKQQSECETMSH